jgi:hypothetical protein
MFGLRVSVLDDATKKKEILTSFVIRGVLFKALAVGGGTGLDIHCSDHAITKRAKRRIRERWVRPV